VSRFDEDAAGALSREHSHQPVNLLLNLVFSVHTPLLIDPAGQKAAINDQDFTGYKAGGIGKPETQPRPQAPQTAPNLFIGVRVLNSLPRAVSCSKWRFRSVSKTPGAIAIHVDSMRRPLQRQRLRQRGNRGFTGRVGRYLKQRDECESEAMLMIRP
jgi:hypothetical protein